MIQDQLAALSYALSLWADWMRNDFAEIRPLWYPARSLVLEPRQAVTEETSNDNENDLEHRIALEVNVAVGNLTATQRACIERSMALNAVVRVRNYEEQLEDARGKIWRHLLSRGCF